MKLYLLFQTDNLDYGNYDSCIVAAESEDKARLISPSGKFGGTFISGWANSPETVEVSLVGTAKRGTKPGVILSKLLD